MHPPAAANCSCGFEVPFKYRSSTYFPVGEALFHGDVRELGSLKRVLQEPNQGKRTFPLSRSYTTQAHTFPHRTTLQQSHPHQFPSFHCQHCNQLDTHFHSFCQCPYDRLYDRYPTHPSDLGAGQWELQRLRTGATSRVPQVAAALGQPRPPHQGELIY